MSKEKKVIRRKGHLKCPNCEFTSKSHTFDRKGIICICRFCGFDGALHLFMGK